MDVKISQIALGGNPTPPQRAAIEAYNSLISIFQIHGRLAIPEGFDMVQDNSFFGGSRRHMKAPRKKDFPTIRVIQSCSGKEDQK